MNSLGPEIRTSSMRWRSGPLIDCRMRPLPPAGHSVAAAREQLDAAMAALLEAATAEVHEDAQLRKALAEGQQLERRRLQAILLSHLELHERHTDPVRVALLNVLEDFAA